MSSFTISSLFTCFINDAKTYGKEDSTIRGYTSSYTKLCAFNPQIGEILIPRLTKPMISGFVRYLQQSGLATASINHHIRNLRVFLYWCMEEGYTPRFTVSTIKERDTLKEPYTKEEIKILLKKPLPSSDFVEWRNWATVNWVLGVASRVATIINIKLQDIDLREGYFITRHNKNKKVYQIKMPPQLVSVMAQYVRLIPIGCEYLFPSKTGTQLNSLSVSHAITKYNLARGVTKTSIHLLRHSFGVLWAENGGDVYGLQRMFNHSDIRTTQKYINLYSSSKIDDKSLQWNPLQNL